MTLTREITLLLVIYSISINSRREFQKRSAQDGLPCCGQFNFWPVEPPSWIPDVGPRLRQTLLRGQQSLPQVQPPVSMGGTIELYTWLGKTEEEPSYQTFKESLLENSSGIEVMKELLQLFGRDAKRSYSH